MHKQPIDKTRGCYLGFDFGMKRIGVAVGQTVSKTTSPIGFFSAHNGVPEWNAVTEVIVDWTPRAIIVGIPINMDGSKQPLTHYAKRFCLQLDKISPYPIIQVDERLTTIAARERLFQSGGKKALNKQSIDAVAAQIILEGWLNTQ